MAMKPNYRHARSERDRAKKQKKEEKLRRREDDTAQRKGEPGGTPETGTGIDVDAPGSVSAPPDDKF